MEGVNAVCVMGLCFTHPCPSVLLAANIAVFLIVSSEVVGVEL